MTQSRTPESREVQPGTNQTSFPVFQPFKLCSSGTHSFIIKGSRAEVRQRKALPSFPFTFSWKISHCLGQKRLDLCGMVSNVYGTRDVICQSFSYISAIPLTSVKVLHLKQKDFSSHSVVTQHVLVFMLTSRRNSFP